MYLGKKLITRTLLLFCIVFTTACTMIPPSSQLSASVWQEHTRRWLRIAALPGGGYAEIPIFPSRSANLYNTWYATLALASLGVEPELTHRTATITWVHSLTEDGQFPDYIHPGTGENSKVTSIYFTVGSLARLGSTIEHPARFAEALGHSQQANGTFLHMTSDLSLPQEFADQRLMNATHHALEAFHLLGLQPGKKQELHQWLQQQWDATIANPEVSPAHLNSLNLLAVSLRRTAPQDPRLQTAWSEIVRRVPIQQWTAVDREFMLLALAPTVYTARVFGIAPETWHDVVPLPLIEQMQNKDGGFGDGTQEASHMQGNGHAAYILGYFGSTGFDRAALTALVKDYAHHEGGYFTMSTAEPHPPATWAAAHLSPILQVSLDTERLQRHLMEEMQITDDPRVIQLGLESAAALGVTLPITATLQSRIVEMLESGSNDSSYLIDHLAGAAIASEYLDAAVPSVTKDQIFNRYQAWLNPDGGYGPQGQSDVFLTANVLLIFQSLAVTPANKETTIEWLRQQQQGGFGSRTTPANMQDTYATLQALARAGVQPKDVPGLQRWIVSTFAPEGGVVIAPQHLADGPPTFLHLRWTAAAALMLRQTGVDLGDTAALQLLLTQ